MTYWWYMKFSYLNLNCIVFLATDFLERVEFLQFENLSATHCGERKTHSVNPKPEALLILRPNFRNRILIEI